jgi:tetratricopeptide (TPR) repeat protein
VAEEEFEEFGGLEELEDLGEAFEEMEEDEGEDKILYDEEPEGEPRLKRAEEPEMDESYEELAKIGAISGRLVDLLVIILAVVMILFFIVNGLYEDVNKVNSLEMGMLLNIGLVGLVVIVLLYVKASSNITKADALCRLDTPEAYREALKKYDAALKIDRRSKKAWTCKGLAMRMLSHDKENLMSALRHHNRALKIDPKYNIAWVNKGNVLFNLGLTSEAIKCYDKAIELNPNYTAAWVNKGELLVKIGNRREAQRCLDRAQTLAE